MHPQLVCSHWTVWTAQHDCNVVPNVLLATQGTAALPLGGGPATLPLGGGPASLWLLVVWGMDTRQWRGHRGLKVASHPLPRGVAHMAAPGPRAQGARLDAAHTPYSVSILGWPVASSAPPQESDS